MRAMSYALQQKFDTNTRKPAYKIYAYKSSDTFSKIVLGTNTTPPIDITAYCSDISWSPAQVSFTLQDPGEIFHSDHGIYKNYISDGCVVRLKEGDEDVDESLWMWTFTGNIKGQLGWTSDRAQKNSTSQVTVFSRDNIVSWKKRQITTKEYGIGTDLGIMLRDVITGYMGVTAAEIRIPPILGRNFYHKVNQICQQSPWDSVITLLEAVGMSPAIDGEGKIYAWSKNFNRAPDLIFDDWEQVVNYSITQRTEEYVNKVIITFLNSSLERVDGPNQCLGTASITTGFFTMKEELKCYWSEDRRQRASGTYMKIIKSVNDNLLPIGDEDYEENDEFSGTITVTISIFVPLLATAMLAAYISSAWWVDEVVVVPVTGTGVTIPIGRVAQATVLIGILAIMMSLGSAQYEVWGIPYDMAYVEKKSICVEAGVEYYAINEKEIKNDFIGTQEWADAISLIELTWEKTKSRPRKITMPDWLGIEQGDIIQLPDGALMMVDSLSKKIKRGESLSLDVSGFRVAGY